MRIKSTTPAEASVAPSSMKKWMMLFAALKTTIDELSMTENCWTPLM